VSPNLLGCRDVLDYVYYIGSKLAVTGKNQACEERCRTGTLSARSSAVKIEP